MIFLMSKEAIVIQLSTVHPPFDTRIFVKECSSLSEAGYDVHLIAQHDKDEKINEVTIHSLPIAESKIQRLTKVIPSAWRKVKAFPKGTIIHFHDSELILVCLFLKMFGYRIVYDIHEHTPKDFLSKDWLPFVLRWPLSKMVNFLEYLAGIFFDGIVTVVPPVTNRFKKRNVVEISNYPKLDNTFSEHFIRKSKHHSDENTAIYIGSITEIRGITVMLDAINLVNTGYHAKLRLGGKFRDEDLESKLRESKKWERVQELGWLSIDEIWEQLSDASVGLSVLQPTPAHLVLESVKIFEYMAAGIPVIASDFPLFRNIIEKESCGVLVDPTSPQKISEALEWLFNNKDEARQMGLNGRAAIEAKYNWEIEKNELLAFYSKL